MVLLSQMGRASVSARKAMAFFAPKSNQAHRAPVMGENTEQFSPSSRDAR